MKECIEIKESFIKKEVTDVIKGVALILMLVHHFFTIPDWYIDGVSYPRLTWLCGPTSICVSVFAFLTGYFYYYTKEKTYRYSVKKATDVWINYLVVFFLLLIPAIALNVYDFSIRDFVLELLALTRPTMKFCWYVVFYVTVMMILPVYFKAFGKCPAFSFCVTMIAPYLLLSAADRVTPESLKGFNQIIEYLEWFPCVASGLIFAKYGLFYQFSDLLRTKSRVLNIVISLVIMCAAALLRYFTESYDFACAPLFIYGLVEIYHNLNAPKVFKPLKVVGKYSLLLWFIHCIFYNQCGDYTQPILYFPRNPLLVTLWGLLLCLIVAVIIKPLIDSVIRLKNHVYDKLLSKITKCKANQ